MALVPVYDWFLALSRLNSPQKHRTTNPARPIINIGREGKSSTSGRFSLQNLYAIFYTHGNHLKFFEWQCIMTSYQTWQNVSWFPKTAMQNWLWNCTGTTPIRRRCIMTPWLHGVFLRGSIWLGLCDTGAAAVVKRFSSYCYFCCIFPLKKQFFYFCLSLNMIISLCELSQWTWLHLSGFTEL